MNSAKDPSKPLSSITASMAARIRSTSRNPSSWISRGVMSVVVKARTLYAYQSSPSGSSPSAMVARVAGA